MTDKVSVIIPARKEPYLRETIKDLYKNAQDEIEVIVVLDGWEPDFNLPRKKGMKTIRNKHVIGMRPSINHAAEIATGKYMMKIDAHCSVGEGWDAILKADCDDNWIVIPSRYILDAPTWKIKDKNRVDYMTYIYPFIKPYFPRMTCRPDELRAKRNAHLEIDEDMGFQGSCYFMHLEHYLKRVGPMECHGYGTFAEESVELGLKTQLGAWKGKVIRNKKTWYAHYSKPMSHWKADPDEAGRITDEERNNGFVYAWFYWWNNQWTGRIRDFEWLVEKFWPLRTWPDNWKNLSQRYTRYELSEIWPILRVQQ